MKILNKNKTKFDYNLGQHTTIDDTSDSSIVYLVAGDDDESDSETATVSIESSDDESEKEDESEGKINIIDKVPNIEVIFGTCTKE